MTTLGKTDEVLLTISAAEELTEEAARAREELVRSIQPRVNKSKLALLEASMMQTKPVILCDELN